MISANGNAVLAMQGSDGNLVLYIDYKDKKKRKAVWSSGTAGHPGTHLVLQGSDGNLVLYDSKMNLLWASGKNSGAVKAVLGNDCNFVVADSKSNTLWSTKTSCTSSLIV